MTATPGRVSPAAVMGIVALGTVTVLVALIGMLAVGYRITRAAACSAAGRNQLHVATEYHPIADTCTVRVFGTEINIFKNNPGVTMTSHTPRQILAAIALQTRLPIPNNIYIYETDQGTHCLSLGFAEAFADARAWAKHIGMPTREWTDANTGRTYLSEDRSGGKSRTWNGWNVDLNAARTGDAQKPEEPLTKEERQALRALVTADPSGSGLT